MKLLQELLQFVPRWEAEHGTEFRVEDMSLLACLHRDLEAEVPSSQNGQKVHSNNRGFF